MKSWQLQDAKARFSELVKYVLSHGPQSITVHGEPAVVVLSQDEYDELTKPKCNFVDLLRSSPLVGMKLDITRDTSTTRDVDL